LTTLLAWNHQQSICADAIRGQKTSVHTPRVDCSNNRTPIWSAKNQRAREWFMSNDQQTIFSVIFPPPIILALCGLDRHPHSLRCAFESKRWINTCMDRSPNWIAPAQKWSSHRTPEKFLCVFQ